MNENIGEKQRRTLLEVEMFEVWIEHISTVGLWRALRKEEKSTRAQKPIKANEYTHTVHCTIEEGEFLKACHSSIHLLCCGIRE